MSSVKPYEARNVAHLERNIYPLKKSPSFLCLIFSYLSRSQESRQRVISVLWNHHLRTHCQIEVIFLKDKTIRLN